MDRFRTNDHLQKLRSRTSQIPTNMTEEDIQREHAKAQNWMSTTNFCPFLAVSRDSRGQGIGQMLVQRMKEEVLRMPRIQAEPNHPTSDATLWLQADHSEHRTVCLPYIVTLPISSPCRPDMRKKSESDLADIFRIGGSLPRRRVQWWQATRLQRPVGRSLEDDYLFCVGSSHWIVRNQPVLRH